MRHHEAPSPGASLPRPRPAPVRRAGSAAGSAAGIGAGLLALLLAACAHDFTLENREVPVHVWLSAPEIAAQGGTIDALVYVGSAKAIEGRVRFPPGVPHVALPTVYVRSGKATVSAVLGGGAVSATRDVSVGGELWIQVWLREQKVTITPSGSEPRTR